MIKLTILQLNKVLFTFHADISAAEKRKDPPAIVAKQLWDIEHIINEEGHYRCHIELIGDE